MGRIALSQNTSLDGGMSTTVEANDVTLGVEHLGDARAPLVLARGRHDGAHDASAIA